MSRYQLAQLNIGITKGPMDSELMAGFAQSLDRINAPADRAAGFVRRLQTDQGDATSITPPNVAPAQRTVSCEDECPAI